MARYTVYAEGKDKVLGEIDGETGYQAEGYTCYELGLRVEICRIWNGRQTVSGWMIEDAGGNVWFESEEAEWERKDPIPEAVGFDWSKIAALG